MPQPHSDHSRPGFVALISVLIIGAVAVTIATSLLLLGIGATRTGLTVAQAVQARALADSCLEEALQQINDSIPFTGTDTLVYPQGTCTYTVTAGIGQSRTVEASGTVGDVVRRVAVHVASINPSIVTDSWQEVADF